MNIFPVLSKKIEQPFGYKYASWVLAISSPAHSAFTSKFLKEVLDKILPNLESAGLDVRKLTNYKVSDEDWKKEEDNWVKKARRGKMIIKLQDGDNYVEVNVAKADLLKAIPLSVVQIVKNI